MKVADYVISELAKRGVTDIFEVYGAANGPLIDAFTRVTSTRYVAVMHEQAGGFAAEGYAKVSGNFGVAIATSGPGGGNMVTSCQNCFYDSVPVLFITGQINSRFLRPDPTVRQIGFQETDIVETVRGISKYAAIVMDPGTIRYHLEKALFLMKEGRPGPVWLDIPVDVQKKEIDPSTLQGFDAPASIAVCETVDKQIDALLADISCAKRPVILVGGGVRLSGAVEKFRALAEKLNVPVFPTYNALDVATDDWPLYGGRVGTFGGKGRNFAIQQCDLLLCVGSRLSGRITGGNVASFARAARRWTIDVDPGLLETKFQQLPFHGNILCDAKQFCELMLGRIDSATIPDFGDWVAQAAHWRDLYDPVLPEYCSSERLVVHPYHFYRELGSLMGPDDIFLVDCGGNLVSANHALETKFGQLNITNNGNSPMGFSFAAAMGAYLGAGGKRQVVCTIGDGGFSMNIQEIQTVLNYNLAFKTFIVDNRCYGITRQFQRTNFEGRMEACGPVGYNPPDYEKICSLGFGIATFRIDTPRELASGIRQVLDFPGPAVCIVNCKDEDNYKPRVVGWNTPIEDLEPYLPRDEFKANMKWVEPLPGWENPPNGYGG